MLHYIMIRTYGAYRCFATIMIKFAVRQLCKHIGSLALIISSSPHCGNNFILLLKVSDDLQCGQCISIIIEQCLIGPFISPGTGILNILQ